MQQSTSFPYKELQPTSTELLEAHWKCNIVNTQKQPFLECNLQIDCHTMELEPVSTESVEAQWKCNVLKYEKQPLLMAAFQ